MIIRQYYLIIILTAIEQLFCYQTYQLQDQSNYCQEQIIYQFKKQNIDFSQNNKIIEITQNINKQFQLELKDCYQEGILMFKNVQQLNITKLLLLNVLLSEEFIVMQKIESIYIQNLEIRQNITNNNTIFTIKNVQNLRIDVYKSYNTYNIQIACENSIYVGEIILDSCNNGSIESKNKIQIAKLNSLNSNNRILSDNIEIAQIDSQQSEMQIVGNLNVLVGTCKTCNIYQFDSQQVQIKNYYYSCDKITLDKPKDKISLYINNFYVDEIQSEDQLLFQIINYKTLLIDNLEIKNDSEFQFQIKQIQTFHLKNWNINPQINVSFDVEFCDLLMIENVQFVSEFEYNTTLQFSIKNSKSAMIRQFNLSNLLFKDSLFQVEHINNIILEDFLLDSVRFEYLTDNIFNFIDCQNLEFNRMNLTNNQMKNLIDRHEEINSNNSFVVNYFDIYDTRGSLIQFEIRQNSLYDDMQINVTFNEINCDFKGFYYRFFNQKQKYQNLGIYSFKIEITIIKSYFSNTSGNSHGGCILLLSESVNQVALRISQTTFYNCTSSQYGGAIFTNIQLFLKEIIFKECKSKFGGAIVIYDPQYLKQSEDVQNDQNQSKNFDDNIFIYWDFIIDEIFELQEVYNKNYTTLKRIDYQFIHHTPLISIQSQYRYTLIRGIVYIIPLKFYSIVSGKITYFNESLNDTFVDKNYNVYNDVNDSTQTEKYLLDFDEIRYTQNPYFILKMDIRAQIQEQILEFNNYKQLYFHFQLSNCISGQQQIQYSQSSSDNFDCQFCPFMSASYTNNTVCTQCDSLMFQYCYSNISYLKLGYHRLNQTLDQKQIYECKYNKNSCIGGEGFGDVLCTQGHVGIECRWCDVYGNYWNQTFGRKGYYQCINCSKIENNLLVFFSLFIVFILFTYIIISSNINSIEMLVKQTYLSKMNIIYLGQSFRNLGLASVYLKILSFNVSQVYYMQSQMNFNSISSLINLSIWFQNPLSDTFISVDCALSQMFNIQNNYSFVKLLTFIFIPIICSPAILGLLQVEHFFKKVKLRIQFILLSILYLFFIVFYNSILNILLDSLLFQTFQSGDRKSMLDLSVDYDKTYSNFFIAIPVIIFYCIGLPIFIGISLFLNRTKLQNIKVLFKFGFLYKEYKVKYFYWEMIRFLVRISQIIISKVLIYNLIFMNSAIMIITLCYLISLQQLKPFQRSQINKLEQVSVAINILNFQALIVFINQNEGISQINLISPTTIILIISQHISLIFIIYLSYLIIKSFLKSQITKLQSYQIFQRIFRCNFCRLEYTNQQRINQNFKILRQAANKIIDLNRQINHDSIFRQNNVQTIIELCQENENKNSNEFKQVQRQSQSELKKYESQEQDINQLSLENQVIFNNYDQENNEEIHSIY